MTARAEFGEYLRAARNAARMTQAALAGELGVSKDHIYRLESSRQLPGTDTWIRLKEVLDLDPAAADRLFMAANNEDRVEAVTDRDELVALVRELLPAFDQILTATMQIPTLIGMVEDLARRLGDLQATVGGLPSP